MGWWTLKQAGQELLQGDIPYDIVGDALEQIAQEYQKEWKRKPTLSEIVHTIETVLSVGAENFLTDAEEIEIAHLAVKTRRRRKSQPFQVGDFFAIPLTSGQYAFGRILSDFSDMGMLICIYDGLSTRILAPSQLKGRKFIFTPFYYAGEAWRTWKWKIIGNMPLESDEFVYPKHKEGAPGMGWWIRDRDKVRKATTEEAEGLEYATLWSTQSVEEQIVDYFSKKKI